MSGEKGRSKCDVVEENKELKEINVQLVRDNEGFKQQIVELKAYLSAFKWKEVQMRRAHLFAELHDALLVTFVGQGDYPATYLQVHFGEIVPSDDLKQDLKKELNVAMYQVGSKLFEALSLDELEIVAKELMGKKQSLFAKWFSYCAGQAMTPLQLILLVQVKKQRNLDSHCKLAIRAYSFDNCKRDIVDKIRSLVNESQLFDPSVQTKQEPIILACSVNVLKLIEKANFGSIAQKATSKH